MTKLIKKL